MLFSSITFLVFFLPVVLLFYYMLPAISYRNCILLLASLLFYAWGEPLFVFLMLASIIFNYRVGLFLGACTDRRKLLLVFGVLVNLSLLFVFKYLGFSCRILGILAGFLHLPQPEAPEFVMPIGISFYTFQELSYLVDVYTGRVKPEKKLLNLGLYVSFFPQLIAGPIVRYTDIKARIEVRKVSVSLFASGLERFIVGLSKKLLLANSFAAVCDKVYNMDFFCYGAGLAWIAALAYFLQIYYDFSGYSDMAVGLAMLFGFRLPENFNYPYAASSITDFWRRWHISLTDFFRDYVYIPLGGNRKGRLRTVLNRYAVFFLTGLWHGAGLNFILWGLGHGTLMVIERIFNHEAGDKAESKAKKTYCVLLALIWRAISLLAIMLLWVLFRNGTKRSVKILLKMFGVNYTRFKGIFRPVVQGVDSMWFTGIDTRFWILVTFGVLFSFPWWRKIPLLNRTGKPAMLITALRYALLVFLLILCYAGLAGGSYNPFIYFRF